MKMCSNLKCGKIVSDEIYEKESKKVYNILKNGTIEKNELVKMFCDKPTKKSESKCEKAYLIIRKQIENYNDGGPLFSNSLNEVIKILSTYAS